MKKKITKEPEAAAAHGEEQVKTPLGRHICVFMSEVQPKKKERKKTQKNNNKRREVEEEEAAEFGWLVCLPQFEICVNPNEPRPDWDCDSSQIQLNFGQTNTTHTRRHNTHRTQLGQENKLQLATNSLNETCVFPRVFTMFLHINK